MRVLITRPEREAATLAQALVERGHVPVIASLFRLQFLRPPADFTAALADAQAVLLTSANGARALADAAEQRSKPILAVGDTTAATAEGLGFTSVVSASGDAAALIDLVRERLDPAAGPLVHVSGIDIASEIAPEGFDVRRFALYEARQVESLPSEAKAALEARSLDAATFFSPRAGAVFASLVEAAALADGCRDVTAIAISPAASAPLQSLPFANTLVAHRPTRQAMLDEIDRLAEAVVQGPDTMSDTPSSPPSPTAPPPPVHVRRGPGVLGAFVIGLIAAAVVLAGALLSLPYWPEEARTLWRGAPVPAAQTPDIAALRTAAEQAAAQRAQAAIEAARREFAQRLDDLDRRVRAASAATTAAPQAERPAARDPAIDELRSRIEAIEKRPAAEETAQSAHPAPGVAPSSSPEAEKEVAGLKTEITSLRAALTALDQAVAGQKTTLDKVQADSSTRTAGEQTAVAAARASAVIGIAARLNAALAAGLPFAADLALLTPLVDGDARLGAAVAALQPLAASGVPSRAALVADFPAIARAALAEDVADDSFGERVLGKVRGIVSLRRVGADVQGDSAEAKLARAEAALDAGDVAKAVELVKSLPPQTGRATASWLARADSYLAARKTVDELAAHAVAQLGTAR